MVRLFQRGDGLGGYRIARLLGAGGFAEVYEAIDPSGVRRALKVLNPDLSRGPRIRSGLAREADALAQIEHVNVVRFYEAGIEEDYVYLVLELVEGVTLAEKMSDPFALAPLEDVVRWLQQACEGVAEAHRAGVIHRDLKPANILVTPSGVVKVIDFGIAKLRSWSSASTGDHLVGTALYMAPEQLHAQPADGRSDVYSMGVILYEALAGVHPLGLEGGTSTVFQVFQQHLLGEPRPLRDVAPEVPVALAALVHEALAKDPGHRLPSMQQLADRLQAVLLEMIEERRSVVRRLSAQESDPEPFSGPGVVAYEGSSADGPRSKPRSVRPAEEWSPLAVTGAHDPDRSALPPPPPRQGVPSAPPSSRRPPLPVPVVAAMQLSRPSMPRGSSAVPVVADADDRGLRLRAPLAKRRFAVPALALATLVALAGAVWLESRRRPVVAFGPRVAMGETPKRPAAVVAPSPLDTGQAAGVRDDTGKLPTEVDGGGGALPDPAASAAPAGDR